jgi:hypothetical protein
VTPRFPRSPGAYVTHTRSFQTVTYITKVEMPAPPASSALTTSPTLSTSPTTTTATPAEQPRTATAIMKFKSPRASLQLTYGLGGYIRRMRSRAPIGRIKNKINIKPSRLSLSATLRLPLWLGGY